MSQGSLPTLTLCNFSYWYDALHIHASTIDAGDQLNQTPHSTDPHQKQEQRKKQDQLKMAIMQSLSESVVKLLPQHILRKDIYEICATLRDVVDTSAIENHELLDAEARNLQFKAGQELQEYVNGHRDIRYRMQVSGYPNIDIERTTVRYMVQGLAHHPDMHTLAVMMACNTPDTIREFTNHIQQAQLIQAQPTTQQAQPSAVPYTKWEKYPTSRRYQSTTTQKNTQRHYAKPQGHKGSWCHIHGSVTHNTDSCFARKRHSTPRTAQANTATTHNEEGNYQSAEHNEVKDLRNRIQLLEEVIEEQLRTRENMCEGTTPFIIDSGANPTHTAIPHANMRPSDGTLTTTATGQRVPITHSGTITIKQKSNKVRVPAVHAPSIKENLLSVHDLTVHGHVTFSRTKATLHKPTHLPPAQLTAHFQDGQYRLQQKATAKGARTYERKTKTNKTLAKLSPKTIADTPNSTTTQKQRRGDQITINTTRRQTPTLQNTPTTMSPQHTPTAAAQQTAEWHIRLNHANPKTIAHMSRHQLLPGMPKGLPDTSAQMTCTGCIQGKTATRPHKRTAHHAERGESLSSDVCGPIHPPSQHNCRYFLTVIDTNTRYIWVFCLHNRAQVPHTVIQAVDRIATENGQQPRLLVTDNAKEYLAKQVQQQLEHRGIQYRPTTPYTPQENALAERINRTLMDKVRATLAHSKLHDVYWQDALCDAVFKYNITYHHGVKGIPHTLWYQQKPQLKQIIAFGQLGYTPILKPNMPKLHSKASQVRYMYAIDETHICVQNLQTRRYSKMRAADFRAYHRQQDPCENTTAVYNTQSTPLKKSQRAAHIPKTVTNTTAPPKTLKQARQYPDAKKWADAHDTELNQLDNMNAIDWRSQTDNTNRRDIIPTTMTYRYKRDQAGTKHKARCSIRGDRMMPHTHYDPEKTATYMADRSTIRTLFAIAASCNMKIEHFDISGAYLHEAYRHNRKVFVWQPRRFDGSFKHAATHGQLKGNVYGTPAAANIYSTKLHAHLKRHGYQQMRSDTSLFTKTEGRDKLIVGISMDDFLPIATTTSMIDSLYHTLQKKYTVKRMGRPTSYLNWQIRYTPQGTHISQPSHIDSVVTLLAQTGCNKRTTPYLDGITMDPPTDEEEMRADIATIYGKAVGEIRYIADSARPDIAFAATTLARALKKPTQRHWNLLQRLTQYLHSTRDEGILMPANANREITIHAYSDADYANDATNRKSITGMVTLINGAPVQWIAKQQPVVAKSTCEAEYIAAAETTALTLWLHNLICEIQLPTSTPTLHVDNTAAVQMAKSMGATKRRKCIDVRYHYLHDTVQQGKLNVQRIPSNEQYADILTKPLKTTLYRTHKKNIAVRETQDTLPSRRGECGSIQNQVRRSANEPQTPKHTWFHPDKT